MPEQIASAFLRSPEFFSAAGPWASAAFCQTWKSLELSLCEIDKLPLKILRGYVKC